MVVFAGKWHAAANAASISAVAIVASMALFGVFLTLSGANPFGVFESIYRGAFGS